MSIDFAQVNAQASDPFPIAVGTTRVAGIGSDIYVAQTNGWLLKLNPATNVLDDFIRLTNWSGRTSLTNAAMCSQGGSLWVIGRGSTVGVGTDISIYKVNADGTAEKHGTWTTSGALRSALSLNEDPVEPLLYFATDSLLSAAGVYGIVRYDIAARTFTEIINANQMIVSYSRSPGNGPGYQIRDAAVRSDQSLIFVGNQRNDTNDPLAASHYGRSLLAWTDGKPAPGTTGISLNWYADQGGGVPLNHAALGSSFYCVPNTVTIGPDDTAWFTWQVASVTG